MEAVFGRALDPSNLAQAAVALSGKAKQRATHDEDDNDGLDGVDKPRKIAIVLFRNDLRVHDNAALYYAQHHNKDTTHILPVYVFDERQIECSGLPGYKRKGPEARTRLCKFWRTGVFRARLVTEAVFDLRHRLKDRGSNLLVRYGFPENVIENIVKTLQAKGDEIVGVHIQKEICSEEIQVERQIRKRLDKVGVSSVHFHDLKHMVAKEDVPFSVPDTPDVFTPFRKKVEALGDKMVRPLLDMPDKFLPVPYSDEEPLNDDANYGQNLEKEGLETVLAYFFKPLSGSYEIKYADPKAAKHASSAFPWAGGETSALERLEWYFITGNPPPVAHYKETRNMLVGHAYSTKMSPFLCIGCISPRMIYKALDDHEKKYGSSQNTYWVRFELLWRDYFIYISEKYGSQLFQIEGFEKSTDPKAAEAKKDDWNNWDPDNYLVKAWCRGRTGIPFIDANIIELRETGFMSNRGRQNVASFLTKDLYFDWRIGAEFFESHLVDYEPTANWGNWQYVAGVGNDPRASRQFNPIKQARDYDPAGIYVRTWIQQLKNLPNSKVHTPWLMSDEEWKKYMPSSDEIAEQTAGPMSARPTYLMDQHRKQQSHPQFNVCSESSSSGKASTGGSSEGSVMASSNGSIYDSGSTSSTTASDEDNSPGATRELLEAPFFAPGGSKSTSAFKQSLNEPGAEHRDVPVYSYTPELNMPNQATVEMAHHAQGIRDQDVQAHKTHPVRTFNQSATQLTKDMDVLNDYLSGTPYPRQPLFEQQSWKAHYYRKDYGRRANGAGGGNSRRLIRAPKGVPELGSQAE